MKNRIGGVLWIFCGQFFLAEQVTSRAWHQPYSFMDNYISDLGAIHSPWHQVMDASFVVQGILIGVGALYLLPKFRLSQVLLLMSAAGVILVGFAPSDAHPQLHTIGAATHFLAAGLGICVMGRGKVSLLTGLIILIATASLTQIHQHIGAVERVAAYSIVLWLVVSGIRQERYS